MRLGGMCGAIASCRSGSSCRSELVRRGCAGRNPSRTPPRRFGFALASLRRRPPATAFRPRSGAAPPLATAFRPRSEDHGLCPGPRSDAAPPLATAFRPRPGAASRRSAPTGDHGLHPDAALRRCTPTGDHDSRPGATTLALASRPRFWAVFPPRCRDPRRPGGHDLCPGAVPPALGAMTFALGRTPALCPRSGGARCEKPSLLVAGGQNRRFFAVSEVRNGRFCRLFA